MLSICCPHLYTTGIAVLNPGIGVEHLCGSLTEGQNWEPVNGTSFNQGNLKESQHNFVFSFTVSVRNLQEVKHYNCCTRGLIGKASSGRNKELFTLCSDVLDGSQSSGSPSGSSPSPRPFISYQRPLHCSLVQRCAGEPRSTAPQLHSSTDHHEQAVEQRSGSQQ